MNKSRITRLQAKKLRGDYIRIIIYSRVSSDKQEEDGTSLETQLEDCTEYAQENNYIVLDAISEVHTGFELDQRKKFMEIMARCKNGEADAIVFRTYDRLTRNRTHFTVIAYEAAKYGYELLCVKEQFNNENIYQSITREFMAIIAEVERFKIQERTTEGKVKRVEAGKLLNGKKPRYGYTYADDKRTHYKILEEEAAIIQKIDALYLEGYAQRKIANMLTREGIPTPTGKKVWGRTTVDLILKCTEYHGAGYAYNTTTIIGEDGKKKHIVKPIEERIKLPESIYPSIRTKETYGAIQHRLENIRSTAITYRVPKEVLLRGGFIRCAICGRAMQPTIESNSAAREHYQYLVYRCKESSDSKHENSHRTQIAASIVEQGVTKYVTELLKDLTIIKQALTDYINNHNAQGSAEAYENTIQQIKVEQTEIGKDLEGTRGNARQILLAQMNKLEEEMERLEKHKREIDGDNGKWENIKRDINGVIEWLQTGDANFENASFKKKRDILKALGIVVYVSKPPIRAKGIAARSTYEIRVTLQTLNSTPPRSGRC